MRVAAIILNWNRAELTQAAAISVMDQVDEVILVDNASGADDVGQLARFAEQHSLTLTQHSHNLGYAAGNNPAIASAVSEGFDGILVMNNDAVAEPGAVAALVKRLEENPLVGAVQPLVLDLSGRFALHTHCAMDLDRGDPTWVGYGVPREQVSKEPRESGYISGEAFLARAELFTSVGQFDERYEMYFEDSDWSVRARRAGWLLEAVPTAVFRHEWGTSVSSPQRVFRFARARVLFYRLALGKTRRSALRHAAPVIYQELRSHIGRRRIRQAVRGEMGGTLAGLIRSA